MTKNVSSTGVAQSASRPGRRAVIAGQGAYYLLTGVAPFVSRRLFVRATGPKREWWLVQTTGALVTAIGIGLLSAALRDRITPDLVAIASGSALSLTAIDVIYVAKGRIAPTYLADAAVEAALIAALVTASGGPGSWWSLAPGADPDRPAQPPTP
jgi:hypothetical protein